MRGFHRKWQGRIPFCYGQPIRHKLCSNCPTFVLRGSFSSFCGVIQFKLIRATGVMNRFSLLLCNIMDTYVNGDFKCFMDTCQEKELALNCKG